MRLKDKVVVITGGGRGMGKAYSLAAAREGAKVVVNYRSDASSARKVVEEIREANGQALAVQADIGIQEQSRRLIAAAVKEYGTIDVLVANAGILHKASVMEHTEEMFDDCYRTNIKGNFFVAQAAGEAMMPLKAGKIIFCASIAALVGEHNLLAYTASKGAILSMSRVFALELAPYNIQVNVVLPGTTRTDMSHHVLADSLMSSTLVDPIPLGRVGCPEDLVGAILFFASKDSDWCTGQSLVVDGGFCSK